MKANEARRLQYANDKAYREAKKKAGIEYYRTRVGYDPKKRDVCRTALADVKALGQVRQVSMLGEITKMPTLTIEELAEAMGLASKGTLYNWIGAGRFPAGELHLAKGGARVYKKTKAVAMIKVMMKHFEETSHYRDCHLETRARLYAAQ